MSRSEVQRPLRYPQKQWKDLKLGSEQSGAPRSFSWQLAHRLFEPPTRLPLPKKLWVERQLASSHFVSVFAPWQLLQLKFPVTLLPLEHGKES